eukprot:124471_1
MMEGYFTLETRTWMKLHELHFNIVFTCAALSLDIVAIVIASQYNAETSPCGDGTYIVDLQNFLYIGGSVGIFALCLSRLMGTRNGKCWSCTRCWLGLFILVWWIIGLVMFTRMSTACAEEPIGIILVLWCVVPWALPCVTLFIIAMCDERISRYVHSQMAMSDPSDEESQTLM